MTEPVLLGECTICSRHVFRRDDHPDTPEWYRPVAKGPLKPHQHATLRVGRCTLCLKDVQRRTPDGDDLVRGQKGKLVEHRHAKAFTVTPYDDRPTIVPVRDDGPEEYRHWHDHVPWFARPWS